MFFNRIGVPDFSKSFYVASSFLPWVRMYSKDIPAEFAPLGISDAEMKPGSRKIYNDNISKITLFYGGTLTLQFDIMPVLKAVSRSNRNVELVLAGDDGSGERFKEVIDFAEGNSLSYVNHGCLPKGKFLDALKSSDIVIIPMVSGGLPKKFFDAIGSYKPILCLGEGAVADEVRRFGLGWVCDFNDLQVESILGLIDKTQLSDVIASIDDVIDRYKEQKSMELIHDAALELFQCGS